MEGQNAIIEETTEEHHTVKELEDKSAGEGMRTSTHVTLWNMQVIHWKRCKDDLRYYQCKKGKKEHCGGYARSFVVIQSFDFALQPLQRSVSYHAAWASWGGWGGVA